MNQRQHFEQLYQNSPDPWAVKTAWYERRKRQVLLASLPREQYRYGFEPGCGNGETTMALLERCDQLIAADFAESAVLLCNARVQREDRRQLHLQKLQLPQEWPEVPAGGFDLLVVSELAYYLGDSDLALFSERCLASLAPGGHWLMCHWRHQAPDLQQTADTIHAQIGASAALKTVVEHRETDFLLEVWERL
ncbi:class I SAM-dependent methyltransferase [Comamonas koreensis]|uniref:Class I SAM-dependent methyltransferase n=1 Tax=Comamonas koreensis TaxID=160825 RepID=A0AAW4XXG8_9BURK|nr:class I SAM-dependent methyltransferase [Comamonas koreensis]MCD2166162.1 class I SAM-dependent methyltransferase [Comamonas koreensis]